MEFDELISRYRRPLTAAAYHLCGDSNAAQDIVQETLLDACRGFAGLKDADRAGAWLYAILRRKAYDHRRMQRREAELPDDPPSANPDLLEELTRGIVIEQLERLSPEDREILAGKYLLGLSYQELAESLGISNGAVRVRCLRAKEKLRKALSNSMAEEV
jgi:RNA polymerase sigma factor (sigma-70 family)